MSVTTRPKMTADEFIAWAMEQPEGERYELLDGEVWAMSPERILHTRTKLAVCNALATGIRSNKLPCEAFIDGASVRVDEFTVFEPDVLVRCGERLDDDVVVVTDPIILVEVVSPSSRGRDTVIKLSEYFRIGSLRHYLIANAVSRLVVHHFRNDSGQIETRIIPVGPITLNPPGIELPDVFADLT